MASVTRTDFLNGLCDSALEVAISSVGTGYAGWTADDGIPLPMLTFNPHGNFVRRC